MRSINVVYNPLAADSGYEISCLIKHSIVSFEVLIDITRQRLCDLEFQVRLRVPDLKKSEELVFKINNKFIFVVGDVEASIESYLAFPVPNEVPMLPLIT